MIRQSRYAAASREELWSRGSLIEARLTCGEVIEDQQGLLAVDTVDDALIADCDEWIATLRGFLAPDLRMRLVAEATSEESSGTIVATMGTCSVVTQPAHAAADLRLLREIAAVEATHRHAPSDVPIVWRNGTGAVLAHEALGHPHEYGLASPELPDWLRVDVALAERRASFRDVPLARMRHVRVSQDGAPFVLPLRRIEVLLVDGGGFDPLTDVVTLRVAAADLVSGPDVVRLAPFEISEARPVLLQSIAGAAGEPVRYPGVICSREGQELFVESSAPDLLTEPR